jgi:hypothetical protein
MMARSRVEMRVRVPPSLVQLEVRIKAKGGRQSLIKVQLHISRPNRQSDWFNNRYNPSCPRSYIQFLNLPLRRRHDHRRRASCHLAAACRLLVKTLRRSILDRKQRFHPSPLPYKCLIMRSMRSRHYGRIPPGRTLRQCDPSLLLTPKDLQCVRYCKTGQTSNVNRQIDLRVTQKGYSRLWRTTS